MLLLDWMKDAYAYRKLQKIEVNGIPVELFNANAARTDGRTTQNIMHLAPSTEWGDLKTK